MTATREHLAGLELAHKAVAPYSSWCGEQLRLLVEQAKSSPEPVQGKAVHWRALLDPAEIPSQLNTHMHVVGFTDRRAAEDWVAAKLSIDGWNYRLEALYTAEAKPNAELLKLLQRCQEKLDPHRDAVLWGDVCDALSSQRVKP